ncbi:MAG: hypothetical protein ACMX3H_03805 [Sodalis sp. (in: enterobacteria)]|uniref:hypothetical protein n=1 Tax=Sodalis sp. (in: enterobacteria) TaxID=1898979 RepID=UPI0039E3032F
MNKAEMNASRSKRRTLGMKEHRAALALFRTHWQASPRRVCVSLLVKFINAWLLANVLLLATYAWLALLMLYPACCDVYDRIVAQGKGEFVRTCAWFVGHVVSTACSYAVAVGLVWMVFSSWERLLSPSRIPSPERSHATSNSARHETGRTNDA